MTDPKPPEIFVHVKFPDDVTPEQLAQFVKNELEKKNKLYAHARPLPDLSDMRLTSVNPRLGTIVYHTPVHDDDIANVNRVITQHYRSGVRVGLIIGFVVAAVVMYLLLLITNRG